MAHCFRTNHGINHVEPVLRHRQSFLKTLGQSSRARSLFPCQSLHVFIKLCLSLTNIVVLVTFLVFSMRLSLRRESSRHGLNLGLLMSGQARSINRTVCNFEANIVAPLLGAGYSLRAFIAAESSDTYLDWHVLAERLRVKHHVPVNLQFLSPFIPPQTCVDDLNMVYHRRVKRAHGANYVAFWLNTIHFRQMALNQALTFERAERVRFDYFIAPRVDVAYASALPTPLHPDDVIRVPFFQSWGGINDRFAMGSRSAMITYHNLYEHLCGARRGARELPPGSNSERIYAWHLKKENIQNDKFTLFRFVFYRTRMHLEIEDSASPDFRFARSWFNFSPRDWKQTAQEVRSCSLGLGVGG